MSGSVETALTGAFVALGGYSFARLGWTGMKRRAAEPAPGQELATPSAMAWPAWKLLWAFLLLFGLFALGCGLLLMIGPFLPGAGR